MSSIILIEAFWSKGPSIPTLSPSILDKLNVDKVVSF